MKDDNITIRISKSDKERLYQLARKEDRSIASLIIHWLHKEEK